MRKFCHSDRFRRPEREYEGATNALVSNPVDRVFDCPLHQRKRSRDSPLLIHERGDMIIPTPIPYRIEPPGLNLPTTRINHHTQETVVEAIHKLAGSSSVCRVAVAYCGKAAYKFFPESPAERPEDLRVIVDASEAAVRRGLTNPDGLLSLLGLNAEVRSLPGLHAKAFIFDRSCAIVGSANMSETSISQQLQLGVEVCDSEIVPRLVKWFDIELWRRAVALDAPAARKLRRLWPNQLIQPGRKTNGRLPPWRGGPPQPPLETSEFTLGVTNQEIGRLMDQFTKNRCPYTGIGGKPCSEFARNTERKYAMLGKRLHSLWRRRSSWDKADLGQLFDLAYTNGRAAKMKKPLLLGEKPAKVVLSLEFLLRGSGDPYVRFEKLITPNSVRKIRGLGEAGLAFLMHIDRPESFAVVNASVDSALERLQFRSGQAESRQKGQALRQKTAAVKHIAELTGLTTFGRVDHFLDAIAKGHIGPARTS